VSSVSYRLPPQLKSRLAERAAAEGTTETALVSRLLDEGLKTTAHAGIVYRGGAAGRRAAVAGGPDVWEIVAALRHAEGTGESRVSAAAEQLGLHEHIVRLAIAFASEYPGEVQDMISANEVAAERARQAASERERFIAS